MLAVFSWFHEATPVNILLKVVQLLQKNKVVLIFLDLKVDDDVLFDPDRLQLILQLDDQTKQAGHQQTGASEGAVHFFEILRCYKNLDS